MEPKKHFADGKVTVPFKIIVDYVRGENDNFIAKEKLVAIVHRIYRPFLRGRLLYAIAKILLAKEIPSPGGKKT